jgi:hypothetical protein
MKIYYYAHAVSPINDETLAGNIAAALALYRAIQLANHEVLILAPWLLELVTGVGDDAVPEDRRRGLARCFATCAIRDLSGIILAGPRISPGGMLDETIAMFERNRFVEVHRVRSIVDDLIIRPLHTVDEYARILCHAGRVAPIGHARATEIELLDAMEARLRRGRS